MDSQNPSDKPSTDELFGQQSSAPQADVDSLFTKPNTGAQSFSITQSHLPTDDSMIGGVMKELLPSIGRVIAVHDSMTRVVQAPLDYMQNPSTSAFSPENQGKAAPGIVNDISSAL